MTFETDPADPVGCGTPGKMRPACSLDAQFGIGGLLRSLGPVPPIGGEHRRFLVGPDQQRCVRTGETRQITHVDQVRYQHGVQIRGGQPLP